MDSLVLKIKSQLQDKFFERLTPWLKITFLLGLIAFINYLPAYHEDYDPFAAYQRGSLSSTLSWVLGISIYPNWPTEADYNFYWEFITARQLINADDDSTFHYIE